ncbi:MAG TPA: glutamate racemase [Saprospiraceae bacterium]|nr:glutamate racemase [Saprospiraceae bacterium]
MTGAQPIGIFDSGIGGLTIAHVINKMLPQEHLIYFGDTAHLPYGEKSSDAIKYYSIKISKFLIEQQCKMVVIACNTASAAAYETLLDFYDGKIIFVNVVDPLVDKVIQNGYERIGLIGTKATVNSQVYKNKIKSKVQKAQVEQLATPLLVPMIEEGYYKGQVSELIIKEYLDRPEFKNIEVMLLACTHYPLIKDYIIQFFDGNVEVMDSMDVTALEVQRILNEQNILNHKRQYANKFYVSDYTEGFDETAQMFYGKHIDLVTNSIW